MQTLNAYIGVAFILILVYLVVVNASGANAVLKGLSSFNTSAIAALQGRSAFTG